MKLYKRRNHSTLTSVMWPCLQPGYASLELVKREVLGRVGRGKERSIKEKSKSLIYLLIQQTLIEHLFCVKKCVELLERQKLGLDPSFKGKWREEVHSLVGRSKNQA